MNVRRVVPIVTVDDVALAVEQYSAVLGLDVTSTPLTRQPSAPG